MRGGIVDVFPSTGREPLRVELFGDEIEQVRAFSPFTQRALHPADDAVVYPAAERRADLIELELPRESGDERATRDPDGPRRRRSSVRPTSSGSRTRCGRSLRRRVSPVPALDGRHRARPVPAVAAVTPSRRSGPRSPRAASPRPRTSSPASCGPATGSSSRSRIGARHERQAALLRKVDAPLLEPGEALPEPSRSSGSPSHRRAAGFVWRELGLVLLPDTQVFRKRPPRADRRLGRALASFADLRVGDYVVHEDHGVGKLLGFETKEVAGVTRDYLFLAFRGEDRLYVPHEQLGKLSKYIGADATAPALSKLGGKAWQNLKARARDVGARARRASCSRSTRSASAPRGWPTTSRATGSNGSRPRSRTARPTTSSARSRP